MKPEAFELPERADFSVENPVVSSASTWRDQFATQYVRGKRVVVSPPERAAAPVS